MVGIAIVLWVLLNRHRFGAHVYLVGDNEQSARMMGVRSNGSGVSVFAFVGLSAAFAGIASTLETNYFWPTVGSGAMLPTVAAVFLGGTSIFGGRGTIFGTFVAAFVIGAIEPGIVSLGWTGLLTQVIYGGVIVGALIMQSFVTATSPLVRGLADGRSQLGHELGERSERGVHAPGQRPQVVPLLDGGSRTTRSTSSTNARPVASHSSASARSRTG